MHLKIQKMMEKKRIENLDQLREAKRKLKIKMALADKRAKEGFLYSTFNRFFNSVESSSVLQRNPLSKNIHNSLNFLSNKASDKFELSKTTQSIVSAAIVLAAPFIAKKLQDFIDRYN